ncbi:GNAT family N-acetyltransferase [bacterium]|nr:MAG: GNAT family N-acetyltransferase [bacterium]
MADHTPDLRFSRERPDSEEARTLIRELDADLLLRYPEQWIHGLHPEDIQDDELVFLVVRHGTELVGCGALRPLEAGMAEIKRMFVRPPYRGRGISRKILGALESIARERGYAVLRLETGTEQPEALALYRSSGYAGIPSYGEYLGNPYSICFEKKLDLA